MVIYRYIARVEADQPVGFKFFHNHKTVSREKTFDIVDAGRRTPEDGLPLR